MRGGSLARLFMLAGIWGSSYLWIKLALRGFSPIQLVLVRVALGAAVLLAICYVRSLRLPRGRGIWGHLVVAAFLANALPFTLFAVGELTVASAVAGILNSTMPIWAVVFALLVRAERRLTPLRAASVVVGFGGAVLVLAPWQLAGGLGSVWGALACLCAAASYAAAYLYMEFFLVNRGLPQLSLAAAQLCMATVLLLMVLPVAGLHPVQLRADALAGVAVLGAMGTGIAYILNYRLIGDEGAGFVSLVGYLIPVVAVILGAVFLGESLGWNALAGTVLVLAGVGLARRRKVSADTAHTTAAPDTDPARTRDS